MYYNSTDSSYLEDNESISSYFEEYNNININSSIDSLYNSNLDSLSNSDSNSSDSESDSDSESESESDNETTHNTLHKYCNDNNYKCVTCKNYYYTCEYHLINNVKCCDSCNNYICDFCYYKLYHYDNIERCCSETLCLKCYEIKLSLHCGSCEKNITKYKCIDCDFNCDLCNRIICDKCIEKFYVEVNDKYFKSDNSLYCFINNKTYKINNKFCNFCINKIIKLQKWWKNIYYNPTNNYAQNIIKKYSNKF